MHPDTDDPGTDGFVTDDLAPLRAALGDLLTARRNAAGLTQRQLAHRVNYARSTVGGAEGGHRVPAESFWKQCDQLLGGGGELLRAYHQLAAARTGNKQRRDLLEQARRDARYRDVLHDGSLLPSLVERLDATDGGGVAGPRLPSPAERVFVDLIGAAVPTSAADPETVDVTEALLRHGFLAAGPAWEDPPDLDTLRRSVAAAKTAYQAAQHARATRMLPALLDGLRSATTVLSGDAQLAAWALTAETYHVAASIQLKAGKEGPAWLAADRSASAAERSGDPVMAVSSARIVARALTAGGDHARATALANRVASSAVLPTSNAAVSVYGALLLRGAVAAARGEDRAGAHGLLEEAADASRRLGGDYNHAWTAFGPTNVAMHRVHVAVVLGDAGSALDHARGVDLKAVPLAERRACLFLDIAAACAQWGKLDRAVLALQAAYDTAPEELTGRDAVRVLVRDIARDAPPSARAHVALLAERIGVA